MSKVIHLPDEPGRPRKIVRRRSARMQERVAVYHEDSARFVEADRVVRAVASGNDLESLHIAREELAREAAGILFTRLQAVPGSRELGRLASRRIAALREIVNVTLAIARADQATPAPATMDRILDSLADVVNEAAAAVLPEAVAKKFATTWRNHIEPHLDQLRLGVPGAVDAPLSGRVAGVLSRGTGDRGKVPTSPKIDD